MPSNFRYPFFEHLNQYKKEFIEIIENNWKLNRTAVNPDTDELINYIKMKVPEANILELQAGKDCLTWTVPYRWKVNEAYIARLNGEKIVEYKNNALHLWTHSVPVDAIIPFDELSKHVLTNPYRPDEFEYHFRNGYRSHIRDWGFSIPFTIYQTMKDSEYKVKIDSILDTNGMLKVVDLILPGTTDDTIILMAHTCHPWIVNDGLSCVATLIELYRWLKALTHRKYTYRFILGPEYFAAAAFLDKVPQNEIDKIKFGLYLDMVGNHEPIGFQTSFQGDSLLDKVVYNVLKTHAGTFIKKPYRKLWPNDETFYNGPHFNIPIIGFGRGMYREYHYNTDNLENLNVYHCIEALWYLIRIIEVLDTDFIPQLTYKGPLYLSAYDLYIDPYINPDGYDAIEYMQILMDGKRSCFDVADQLNADYFFVYDFAEKLVAKKLAKKKYRILYPDDFGPKENCKGVFVKSEVVSMKFPWEKS